MLCGCDNLESYYAAVCRPDAFIVVSADILDHVVTKQLKQKVIASAHFTKKDTA